MAQYRVGRFADAAEGNGPTKVGFQSESIQPNGYRLFRREDLDSFPAEAARPKAKKRCNYSNVVIQLS